MYLLLPLNTSFGIYSQHFFISHLLTKCLYFKLMYAKVISGYNMISILLNDYEKPDP